MKTRHSTSIWPLDRQQVRAATLGPAASASRVACMVLLLIGVASACATDPDASLVADSIRTHGGEVFERSEVSFEFRGISFRVQREAGRFLYERSYLDSEGRQIREGMDNDGTWMEVAGVHVPLADAERSRIETAVNSAVYFGFLPFRLDDPAVLAEGLGEEEIRGELYRVVEVTFQAADGGVDWEDRFVYWFHATDLTLDYLAYRYHRDGGGTRFREAVNRREVDGLLVQDYANYVAPGGIDDIADYPLLLDDGGEGLQLVSMVELDDVRITRSF